MPNKPSQVALIDSDKGNILDVRTRRFLRSVPRWNGSVTRDGKYGLFAPARGGLEVRGQGRRAPGGEPVGEGRSRG